MVDSMTARWQHPVAAKQAQTISPPAQRLTVDMRWLCHSALWANICPKDIVLDVLCIVQMQLCKPNLSCHVPFRENRLSPSNRSTVMNFNI